METKYIADLHLYDAYSEGWRNHLKLGLDGYAMLLIREWNSSVDDDDVVIIAGDIGKCCPMSMDVLKRLKGIKILVVGNHDLQWGQLLRDSTLFKGTHEFINNSGIFVSHKPDVVKPNECVYHIHGHHHQYDVPSMQSTLNQYARDTYRYNCASDLIGHKPRTLQELMLQKELLLEKCRSTNLLQEDF